MLLIQMAAKLESVFVELESVDSIYTSAKTGYGLPFNNRLKYASGPRSASDGNDLSEMVLELYCALDLRDEHDSDMSEPTGSTAHKISNTPARSMDCTHADPGSQASERNEATKAKAARIQQHGDSKSNLDQNSDVAQSFQRAKHSDWQMMDGQMVQMEFDTTGTDELAARHRMNPKNRLENPPDNTSQTTLAPPPPPSASRSGDFAFGVEVEANGSVPSATEMAAGVSSHKSCSPVPVLDFDRFSTQHSMLVPAADSSTEEEKEDATLWIYVAEHRFNKLRIDLDDDFKVVSCNPGASEQLGYDNESDLVGVAFVSHLCSPAARPLVREVLIDAMAGNKASNFAFKLLGQGGKALRLVADVRRRRHGNAIIGITIKQSRPYADLYALTAGLGAMVMVTDDAGKVTACNETAADALGFEASEMIGKPLLNRVKSKTTARECLAGVSLGESYGDVECKLVKKNGEFFRAHFDVGPVRMWDEAAKDDGCDAKLDVNAIESWQGGGTLWLGNLVVSHEYNMYP